MSQAVPKSVDTEVAVFWRRVDALPFVAKKRGARNYWALESQVPPHMADIGAAEDAAFALLRLMRDADGKFSANVLLERIALDAQGSNVAWPFFRILEQALAVAARTLDLDGWQLKRVEQRQALAAWELKANAESTEKRSARARHAALAKHRRPA